MRKISLQIDGQQVGVAETSGLQAAKGIGREIEGMVVYMEAEKLAKRKEEC